MASFAAAVVATRGVAGDNEDLGSWDRQGLRFPRIQGAAPAGVIVAVGAGVEAVGDLSVLRVRDGLRLTNREVHLAGDDVLIAGDLQRAAVEPATGDAG